MDSNHSNHSDVLRRLEETRAFFFEEMLFFGEIVLHTAADQFSLIFNKQRRLRIVARVL